LKPPQQPPHSRIIVAYTGVTQMRPECPHEYPHVVVSRAGSRNPFRKFGRGLQLPRPCQDILVGAVNLAGSSGNRNCKFVPAGPEGWEAINLTDLPHNSSEHRICRRKGAATFDLDLQNDRIPATVVSVHDNIVERMTFSRPLKLDSVNPVAGQASGFIASQQG
jgi:hypothetical protein